MIARQFLRFAAVGAVATTIHYLTLIALVEVFAVEPLAATLTGFAAGAVVGYSLNRRYTFDTRPAYASGLFKFLIVIGVGAAINTAIFAFFVRQGLHYMAAQVIATGIVLVWNYAGSRLVVFR
jgi:putative flippase GtrA